MLHVLDVIIHDKEQVRLDDVVLESSCRQAIGQLIREFRYVDALSAYKLPVNNKVFLHGSSGCGKTTTAKAIAQALGKPLYVLNLSNIVSARIGESSQQLKMVFDKAGRDKAVLFLDEFDQIGKRRGSDDQDVGEMRRLVNTLIQLIDYFPPQAMLIAATNYPELIDNALLRRFQLRLKYELPDRHSLDAYYDQLLAPFPPQLQQVGRQYGISFAEARDEIYTQVKALLIAGLEAAEAASLSEQLS